MDERSGPARPVHLHLRRIAGRAGRPAVRPALGVFVLDVEVVCSDPREHRRRVESRRPDIANHRVPTWPEVGAHDFHAWTGDRVVVDTAVATPQTCVAAILARGSLRFVTMTAGGDSVLGAIGRTPLVHLRRIVPAGSADVIVKLELTNPTGSYKDRMALAMIEGAEARGVLRPACGSSSSRAAAPARRSRWSAPRRDTNSSCSRRTRSRGRSC